MGLIKTRENHFLFIFIENLFMEYTLRSTKPAWKVLSSALS